MKLGFAFILWWIFWGLIQFFILLQSGIGARQAIIDASCTILLLGTFGFILLNIIRYYSPGLRGGIYLFIWCLIFSLAGIFLFQWMMPKLNEGIHGFVAGTFWLRVVFAWFQLSFFITFGWLYNLLRDQQEQSERTYSMQQMLGKAELYSLRQRLQPHFLFNSLNSVNALIASKPEDARKMIHQLSDFLRGTISREDGQLVTFSDEMKQLSLYLEIEKVRFGHRLKANIEVEDVCFNLKLPALILQPIVENAIKFGLYQTTGETSITISGEVLEGSLIVKVTNPYDSGSVGQNKGTGFGLDSIKRRLYLIYASNNLLEVHNQNNIFTAILKIPQP